MHTSAARLRSISRALWLRPLRQLGSTRITEDAYSTRCRRSPKGEQMNRHRYSGPRVATGGRLAALAALVLGMLVLAPGAARAAVCQSSGPVGGAYTVNVCFSAPADGSTPPRPAGGPPTGAAHAA